MELSHRTRDRAFRALSQDGRWIVKRRPAWGHRGDTEMHNRAPQRSGPDTEILAGDDDQACMRVHSSAAALASGAKGRRFESCRACLEMPLICSGFGGPPGQVFSPAGQILGGGDRSGAHRVTSHADKPEASNLKTAAQARRANLRRLGAPRVSVQGVTAIGARSDAAARVARCPAGRGRTWPGTDGTKSTGGAGDRLTGRDGR
jgi:hypothetical protein